MVFKRVAKAILSIAISSTFGTTAIWGDDTTPKPASQPENVNATQSSSITLDLGNKITLKLIEVPPGKFVMGSPESEKDRYNDESQHEVTISKSFYLGVTPVTVDQFAEFVNASGYKTEIEEAGEGQIYTFQNGLLTNTWKQNVSWRAPGFVQKGNHPVVQLTWNDANKFCEWLSKKSSKAVQLPTESQWEYACRAGAKTAYPWGGDLKDGKGWGNFADQSLKKLAHSEPDIEFFPWDDGWAYTSPVRSFKPNAFGLHDMVGNVWQWCSDYYVDYPKDPVTDPAGPAKGEKRVQRGGCWYRGPIYSRSALRAATTPGSRFVADGMRIKIESETSIKDQKGSVKRRE